MHAFENFAIAISRYFLLLSLFFFPHPGCCWGWEMPGWYGQRGGSGELQFPGWALGLLALHIRSCRGNSVSTWMENFLKNGDTCLLHGCPALRIFIFWASWSFAGRGRVWDGPWNVFTGRMLQAHVSLSGFFDALLLFILKNDLGRGKNNISHRGNPCCGSMGNSCVPGRVGDNKGFAACLSR